MKLIESEKVELKRSTAEIKERVISIAAILNKDQQGNLSPQDYIRGEERSVLRNPLIAEILYLSKKIEKWGSGLKRIYEECRHNNAKVKLKKLKTGFLVVFYRKNELWGTVSKGSPKKFTKKVHQKIKTKTKNLILESIRKNNNITIKEIFEKLNVTSRTVKKHIKNLKDSNNLKRIGSARKGYWKIIYNEPFFEKRKNKQQLEKS